MAQRGGRLFVAAALALAEAGLALADETGPTTAGPVPPAASRPSGSASTDGDPLEPFNRAMFAFNEEFDTWLLRPAAVGWDAVVPGPAQRSVANLFENTRFPIRFVNALLQGRIDPAAITLCRFLVNSTFGLGGLFDVAATLDLPPQDADFGQTLGRWGIPGEPYLVWPVFGSSNPRDTVGLVADTYINLATFFIEFYYLAAARVTETVNGRALALDEVDRARDASLDFYVAVRSAYLERRRAFVEGESRPTREREEELYFPDYSDQEVLP